MRPYEVTAEFYDLLQAANFRRIAVRLARAWLGSPRVGVLEVGAGTGVATELLATSTSVPIYAVEPAASMRSILLSRLAGRTELLAHVRVWACAIDRLDLRGAADVAWCLNTLSGLDTGHRAAALRAMATALVPGGRLIVQRPPTGSGPRRAELPAWDLGGDRYGGDIACERLEPDKVRWRFTYRVSRGAAVIRTATEDFIGYLVPAAAFDADLRAAGFDPFATDEPDVVVATRR